jgi:hypothetical protein
MKGHAQGHLEWLSQPWNYCFFSPFSMVCILTPNSQLLGPRGGEEPATGTFSGGRLGGEKWGSESESSSG